MPCNLFIQLQKPGWILETKVPEDFSVRNSIKFTMGSKSVLDIADLVFGIYALVAT